MTTSFRSKAVWAVSPLLIMLCLAASAPAFAQGTTTTPPAQSPAAQPAPGTSNDARVDPLQPDFNLVALPVTLRVPAHKLSFRVTHRFTRSLGRGDVGDLLSDFFGFDSGAQIGLEVRYGLRPGTQVGINRTSDRTIELFGQQSILQEREGHAFGLDAIATFEGQNNLRDRKTPAVGVLASKRLGRVAAVYAEPIYVFNTNPIEGASGGDQNTFMVGVGGRLRIRPATYLVGEITPRVGGYKPGVNQASFGLEARAGGHLFQINFGNGLGTTLGQLARGGVSNDSWFIGFNISRKFF